jgi:hypothetical protein
VFGEPAEQHVRDGEQQEHGRRQEAAHPAIAAS